MVEVKDLSELVVGVKNLSYLEVAEIYLKVAELYLKVAEIYLKVVEGKVFLLVVVVKMEGVKLMLVVELMMMMMMEVVKMMEVVNLMKEKEEKEEKEEKVKNLAARLKPYDELRPVIYIPIKRAEQTQHLSSK